MSRALFVVVGDAPVADMKGCAGLRLFTDESVPLASISLLPWPCLEMRRWRKRGDVPAVDELAEVRVPAHRNAEVFAGALIGAGTSPGGMSVWVDGEWDDARFDEVDDRALHARTGITWLWHVDLGRRRIWLLGDGIQRSAVEVARSGSCPIVETRFPHVEPYLQSIVAAGFVVNPAEPSPLARGAV